MRIFLAFHPGKETSVITVPPWLSSESIDELLTGIVHLDLRNWFGDFFLGVGAEFEYARDLLGIELGG